MIDSEKLLADLQSKIVSCTTLVKRMENDLRSQGDPNTSASTVLGLRTSIARENPAKTSIPDILELLSMALNPQNLEETLRLLRKPFNARKLPGSGSSSVAAPPIGSCHPLINPPRDRRLRFPS
jgi:hypothetical protein